MPDINFEANEKITFALRSLYNSCGYAHYKMSKFEEYDLYSKNKDFLVSDGVITFTDTNGRLMALKPDVTLSIIKNTEKSSEPVQKLYYDENVYRVSKSTHSFRELMQVGLECIGEVDFCCVAEVLSLALESLECISPAYVLDISSLDILTQLTASAGVPENEKNTVLRLIGEKNTHELAKLCRGAGVSEDKIRLLSEIIALHGSPEMVFEKTDRLFDGVVSPDIYMNFKKTVSSVGKDKNINIDFSVTNDINYYNGIVFKGFVAGVPNSVLSGGRYDALMRRMNRSSGAIGFAVYTDMLGAVCGGGEKYDADTVIVYGENERFEKINERAAALRKNGERVLLLKNAPKNIRYRKILDLSGEKI